MPTYKEFYKSKPDRQKNTTTLQAILQALPPGQARCLIATSIRWSLDYPDEARTGFETIVEDREHPGEIVQTVHEWWLIEASWREAFHARPQHAPRLLLGLYWLKKQTYRILMPSTIPLGAWQNITMWTGPAPDNAYVGSCRIPADRNSHDALHLAIRPLRVDEALFQERTDRVVVVAWLQGGNLRIAYAGSPMPLDFTPDIG